ncbi:MAG: hypothetical protein LBO69_08395, partial [Ignavibacteria bacterium]|nr:hypothetical protein [Ignavibacteria bacterium]
MSENSVVKNLVIDGYIKIDTLLNGYYHSFSPLCSRSFAVPINCISFVNITINSRAASISGMIFPRISVPSSNPDTNMKNCINAGNIVVSDASQVSGLSVLSQPAKIFNCLNLGNLSNNSPYGRPVHGISDGTTYLAKTINCINAGFTNNATSGQLMGIVNGGTVQKCLTIGVCLANSPSRASGISRQAEVSTTSNYYDRQMCPYGGINGVDVAGQAEGKLTTNGTLTGTALQSILGTDDWVYEDSMYPRLKCFDTMTASDAYRKEGYDGASPVFLHIEDDANYDKHNSVTHCFKVSMKHGVTWESANGRVSIDADGNVALLSLGWDTLTCWIMT